MKIGHKFQRDQEERICERVWREETEERNDSVISQSQQKIIFKKQPHVLQHTKVVMGVIST